MIATDAPTVHTLHGYTITLHTGSAMDRGEWVPAYAVTTSGPSGRVRALSSVGFRDHGAARAFANQAWTRLRGGERHDGATCHPVRPSVGRNPYDMADSQCADCRDAQSAMEQALDI